MRQRKDFKRKEGIRSARLVVIAAEGRFTEKIYFEAMKVSRQASDVHVEMNPITMHSRYCQRWIPL